MAPKKVNTSNKSKKSSKTWIYVSAGVVVLLAILIAVFWGQLQSDYLENEPSRQGGDSPITADEQQEILEIFEKKLTASFDPKNIQLQVSTIESVSWRKGGKFLREMIARGKPLKVTDNPSVYWPMVQRDFDMLGIANEYNVTLDGVRWKHEPLFILSNERDKGGMIGSKKENAVAYFNTTLSQFMYSALKDKSYFYWTGELSTIEQQIGMNLTSYSGLNEVDREISTSWKDFKILEPGIESLIDEDDQDIWRPMLWLSHPGVVAQTHYDTQHNIFIQVHGMKKFHLFAPESDLHSYPNTHRSYRQSQIRLENFNTSQSLLDAFPQFKAKEVIEVIVYPGDILYIPPYWPHRVESLTLSASISVLSPSVVESKLAEAYWHPVPFGGFQGSAESRSAAVFVYLTLFFRHLNDLGMTFTEFSRYLSNTRFIHIPSQSNRNVCPPVQIVSSAIKNITMTDIVIDSSLYPELYSALEKDLPNFVSAADQVTNSLHDILDKAVSDSEGKTQESRSEKKKRLAINHRKKGILQTFCGDYVEQIVRWGVGSQNIQDFLRKC